MTPLEGIEYEDDDEYDDDESDLTEREPPVPPGLGSLSPALASLAEFLEIDEDLIAAAS